MACERCGECCKHTPCIFAQIRYNLKNNGDKCPDLIYDGAPYTCMWQLEDKEFREWMSSGECDYPEWQKVKGLAQVSNADRKE